MGLIYSSDIILVDDGDITARSTAAGYAKVDIMDYWHLKARHRANDVTKSDTNPLFRFDMDAAKTIVGVYLSDVNYNKVRIRAHASDLGTDWSTSTYNSGDVSLAQNPWTGRYQGYVPCVFNLRYMAVLTPAAASAVGDYTTLWETGAVAIFDSVTELAVNFDHPLQQWADDAILEVGRSGVVQLSDVMQWHGAFTFGNRLVADETELQLLNRTGRGSPVLVYLNDGNTSLAYLCKRKTAWKSSWFVPRAVRGDEPIAFDELVGM